MRVGLEGFGVNDIIFEIFKVFKVAREYIPGFVPRIKAASIMYLSKPLHSLPIAVLQENR